MTEVEIIRGVIERLKDPAHWIKEAEARDTHGIRTFPSSDNAVQWCLGGAVMWVTQNEYWQGWYEGSGDPVGRRLHQLARDRGFGSMHPFVVFNNDPDTTHEDLMMFLKEALYDAEIEELQAKVNPRPVPAMYREGGDRFLQVLYESLARTSLTIPPSERTP